MTGPEPRPAAARQDQGADDGPCDCPRERRPDYFCPVHEAHLLPAPATDPVRALRDDGIGRAKLRDELMAALQTAWQSIYGEHRRWNLDDHFADALLDGPLAAVLAQADADRQAVQRGLAAADTFAGGAVTSEARQAGRAIAAALRGEA